MAEAVPEELRGLVISRPLAELPSINAKIIRDTTELHLAKRGIQKLWGFERLVNLEVLWLNDNRVRQWSGADSLE